MKQKMGLLALSSVILLGSSYAAAQDVPVSSSTYIPLIEEQTSDVENPQIVLLLSDVLEEARNNNQEILAAKKRWEAEKAKIWAVKTWEDPELGVEFWGTNETWYDVSQKVPFPGKKLLKGKAQQHEAGEVEELYKAKEKEILQKVKSAYYSYFLAIRQIEIFEESVSLLKRFSKVAENKYSVNRTGQLDVLKAQVEYFKSLNALVTLRQEKETVEAELNALLNRRPDSSLGKPVEPGLAPFDISYDDLVKIAQANRPEVRSARHHVEQTKADLRVAWSEFLPDTYFQYSRRTFDNDEKDDNIFIVKFNVPAWIWGKGSAVKSARKTKEEAQAMLQSVETMTYSDVKSMLVKTQTARRLMELYKTSVIPQAETSLKVSTAGYEAGNIGFLDLLDSERTWLEFQMEYYQYLAQYWTYLAALERVVGEDLVPFEGVR